ncbi:MAG: hypothetical protein ACPGYV_13320 [Phycisphaeraceae bacterium]
MPYRLCILLFLLASSSAVAIPTHATPTPVDAEDDATLEASASVAFHHYLEAIDAGELADAYEMVLDPGHIDLQNEVIERLAAFVTARQKHPVSNEGLVVRTAGPWAMVVYQYDTLVAGKAARVITTAWMMQHEGFWRQFILAPDDERFWDETRSDYERLQNWFDEHAEDLAAA